MLFNSVTFIIFFIIVTFLYYTIPFKFKWVVLLISSYIFYMAWNPALIILILFSTFVNYFLSLKIHNSNQKKILLLISFIVNFGLLFIFKYSVFINNSFIYLFSRVGVNYPVPEFSIILPMGISFYTFQAASYTIDIYRKQYSPEKDFFKFSLFITFFPQLVAGPIERTDRLLPQLFKKHKFKMSDLILGTKFMLWGFFKKIVIADRIAVAVNTVYNSPNYFEGLAFIIATFLFCFQIYCDFSGYSDIALGCAKILGIDLMENFKSPYFSASIKEFWRRWHISLSTWFKDYVYIPLGGSRGSKFRSYINLLLTFLISGMWHGANWTFLIWGGLHGLYQIAENLIKEIKSSIFEVQVPLWAKGGSFHKWVDTKTPWFYLFIGRNVKRLICFLLVAFAWIFFRANNLSDAYFIVRNLNTGLENITDIKYVFNVLNGLGLTLYELIISFISISILIFTESLTGGNNIHYVLQKKPRILGFIFYYFVAFLIISLGVFYNAGEFIYFQF